ncbi:MAG TPA: ATP-binding protein [Oculatellaceae cyanobacterium]
MRLSFQQKILSIFLIPFVIEVAFFWILYEMNSSTEKFVAAERKQRQVVQHLNTLTMLLGNSLSTVFYRDQWEDEEFAPDNLNEMNSEVSQLQQLSKENPESAAQIRAIEPIMEEQIKMLVHLHALPRDALNRNTFESLGFRKTMQAVSFGTQKLTKILKAENEVLEGKQKQQEAAQSNLKVLIISGVFVNFLMALGLGLFFLTDFSRRFKVLINNADRLSEGEPLQEVPGTDELAFLNKVLNETSEELNLSKRRRKHMMEMIAHDLRSPLMSLQLAVDMLINRLNETYSPKAERQMKSIKRNADKMIRLTDDLLFIEKLEGGTITFTPEEIELRECVEDCIDGIKEAALNKNIRIENACGNAIVLTDKKRFDQILLNFLSNAVKYSGNDTVVEVKSQTRSDCIQISVLDQGPGLSKKDQDSVFDRYYQVTGTESKGFGIGLAIVKALVEGQGGKIGVESVLGKGSRFWFTLPWGPSQRSASREYMQMRQTLPPRNSEAS